MRLDITTLKLFVAVAEEKNIARAAEREHIAASAVSKRILDLERDLGVDLLRRHQKGVDLTAAGAALYAHSQSIFSLFGRLTAEMAAFAQGVKGHVRLSANTSAIVEFLPEEIAAFQVKYPDIALSVREEVSSRTVRLVRDGVADLGIIDGSADPGELRTTDFRQDKLVLVVTKDHPLARKKAISFSDSLVYDQVGLEDGSSIQLTLIQSAESLNRPLNMRVRVASFDGLRRLVQSGVGIGVLPEACVVPYEDIMGLKAVPLLDSWAERSIKLCFKDQEALSPPVSLFFQHLLGDSG